MTQLTDSLSLIQSKVKLAADRVGRDPREIIVVAVTKTVGIETLQSLAELGWTNIGENRVNNALNKNQAVPGNKFTWHLIGRLQHNKASKAARLFDFIHSLSSIPLAQQLQIEGLKINKTIRALIQVNTSGEASKNGIKPEELNDFYRIVSQISSAPKKTGLLISGLMTMAPATENPAVVRPYFRQLRELNNQLKHDFAGNDKADELKYLSMGMSQDFEVAIEEGANMLRIGTAIFG